MHFLSKVHRSHNLCDQLRGYCHEGTSINVVPCVSCSFSLHKKSVHLTTVLRPRRPPNGEHGREGGVTERLKRVFEDSPRRTRQRAHPLSNMLDFSNFRENPTCTHNMFSGRISTYEKKNATESDGMPLAKITSLMIYLWMLDFRHASRAR